MTTLVRDIERPSFLDPPIDGQLSLGGASAPVRESATAGRSLSERLRAERVGEQEVRGASARGTARGGGATLDELLVGAWEGLSARRPVTCPVCAGPMLPRAGAAGGVCGACGSQVR